MRKSAIILTILLGCCGISTVAVGQIERERAAPEGGLSNIFWAPTLITQSTGEHLEEGILNVTIMHSFGIATRDVVTNFFGFDNVQNVRLGLDFGISDRWSVGIGRSSLLNVVDFRTKYAVLRQSEGDSSPLGLSLKGDVAVVTQENRQSFEDDLSFLGSAIISRKASEMISLQVSPMVVHFNTPANDDINTLYALGLGSELHFSDRYALVAEYYPVLGDRNPGTRNSFSMGLNIDTGGHVFQLFFASTEWHLEQYVIATNDDAFWAGDFRFGFNVNRIFGL